MTASPFDLSDHVAIVTGGNHGIGAATARTLAACGARVLVAYLRLNDPPDSGLPARYREDRAADADVVVAAIRAHGGAAVALESDLADQNAPSRMFDLAEADLGPVDILVNNASGWVADTFTMDDRDRFQRKLMRVSAETFEQQFLVDARGTALLVSEFARRNAERNAGWGRIVGLTSGGPEGFPGEVSYGAAKAALANYIMSAAAELAKFGITANVVHPPATDTGWVTDEVRRQVRRVAEPDDVARFIAYLASDEAKWVTGNVIHLR